MDWINEFGVVLSVDEHGHVHRGKGEGGGQFTGDNKGKKKTSRTGTDAPSFKAWFGNSKVVDANGEPKETHGTPVKVHHGTTSVFNAFDKNMARAANAGTGFYFAEKRELALAFTGEGVFTDEEWEELDFDEDELRGRIIEAYLSIQNPFVFEDRLPIARATEILEHAEVPIPDSWSDADTVTGWDVWQTIRETVSTKSPPIEFIGDDGRKQMSKEFVGTDGVNEILQELGYDGLSHMSSDWHGSVAKPANSVRGGPGGSSEGGRCWIAFEPTQIKKTTNTTYDPTNPDMNLGLSVDEHGRVHRGKGEKGGQFASKDGPHLDSYSRVVASSNGDIHVVAAQHQTGGLLRKKGKSWEILFGTSSTAEGGGGSVKATGQAGSDAVRVMREVGRTIEDFIKEKSPESFHFSASRFEKSRVRLYDRLAKRLADKHGYTLKRKSGLAEITYTFTTSEPALSVNTPETASARALWANKVQRECLLEAGDDVEAGLAAAAQILALIPVDVTLSVDIAGHQHRGKGEGGGQFTKATGGNGANTKPEPHYPNKLPERFREQYRQQFEDPDHAKLMPALFAIGVPQGPNPRLAAVHSATIPRDLTQGEKVAQQLYSFGADGPMNGALRQDAPVPDQWKLTHEHLQSAFAKAGVLDKPVPVVRGMDLPPDHLKAFLHMAVGARQSGKAIQIKGYTSTATGRHLAPGFKGNVEIQIAAVHGLDMMATTHFPQEQEFLLNHDSQFKVIGVERTSTGYRIQLAQLPPSAHETSPDTQAAHRDGELPPVPKQGLISRIKSLFFSQGDDEEQDGTSSTDQDGIRWDRFTDTSFDHWDLVETNDDTALSIDDEVVDDWDRSLIALSTALEEWSPYLGVRGANKGKQVGWKHVSGRIVYGLDRPGGRSKAQAAPAPGVKTSAPSVRAGVVAKPPKAAKPAKVAQPDKQQVLALVQTAMKQRTPDGIKAALNGLMGLKLPEMRAVLAAAGVKGKGRAKSDLAKLVENQVNNQPVAAPASAAKPAPVPTPKPVPAPVPQQPPAPKPKPPDPAFEGRKKAVEQAAAKAVSPQTPPKAQHLSKPQDSKTFSDWVTGAKATQTLGVAYQAGESATDRFMEDLNKETGYDALPRLVDESEMDAHIAQGGTELFRGVSADAYVDAFKTGGFFAGLGNFGNGTYTARAVIPANPMLGMSENPGYNVALDYSGAKGIGWDTSESRVMRMSLSKDARVVTGPDVQKLINKQWTEIRDLQDRASKLRKTDRTASNALNRQADVFKDLGRYAQLHGYDAIDHEHGYLVVLNRGACIVQRTPASKTKALSPQPRGTK